MPLPRDQAWFPAKRFGWGWGIPLRWQGWVVLLAWIGALAVGATFLAPKGRGVYLLFLLGMTAALLAICYAKGESPSWRWGERK